MNLCKKQYKYLYRKMCDIKIIELAFYRMKIGKSKRKEVIHIEQNFDYYVKKMYTMIINTKPPGVEVEHPELSFMPKYQNPTEIIENGKVRTILKPSIIEQWVHNIILVVIEPILKKRFYEHAYGCVKQKKRYKRKKKRPIYIRTMEKWIHKGFKYFLKLDVRHCYDKIKIKNVINHLRKFICDEYALYLIERCFMQFKNKAFVYEIGGLPLGFRISPWLCNSYMTDLDYMIFYQSGFHEYMRYVDDMIICGKNKKELRKLLVKIKKKLGSIGLVLKNNWQLCRFDFFKNDKRIGRPIDFMGFKYYREKTFLRKHILYRMERIAHKISKQKFIYFKYAMSICSSVGSLVHADCYLWYVNHIKPFVKIKKMRKIVSKHSKKEEKSYDRMEKGKLRIGKTGRVAIGIA